MISNFRRLLVMNVDRKIVGVFRTIDDAALVIN